MMHLGDFPTGATIDFNWSANAQSGASITRGTDGSIRIYKGSSNAQRTSSSGITDTEDFDGLTGLNHLTIDLSDNTDAGFYAAGNEYSVVLQGAVIDSQTVNTVLAHFSIERSGGILALIKNATYGLSALKTLIDTLDDYVDTEVAAIKAKTDSLTFTVAGQVDANIQYVNDVQVDGTGASGDEWGPV